MTAPWIRYHSLKKPQVGGTPMMDKAPAERRVMKTHSFLASFGLEEEKRNLST
jgi:hypothetical protein